MKTLTRRFASVALAGGVAVAALSGCSLFGGSAYDCAAISGTMQETANNLTGDEATFQETVTKLRDEASSISDSELKSAVEEFANVAEEVNKFYNNPSGDAADIPDTSSLTEMQNTFNEKCTV